MAAQRAGLKINVDKTKTMVFGEESTDVEIKVQDEVIEGVKEFVYLGSLLTWNNDCTKEIKRRTAKAKGVMAGLNTIWNSKQISYKTKLNVLKHAYLAQLCMLVRHGQLKRLISRGGDLGGLGDGPPQNLRWGTAHALVPQLAPLAYGTVLHPNISALSSPHVLEMVIVLQLRMLRLFVGY